MTEKLEKWRKEIDEISNCVWKVSLTHELGPKVEKIGENLERIEKEVELSALEMNEQIVRKIKNYPQQHI